MKALKRPVKIVLCTLLALLLIVAAYLVYVLVSYYRIGDQELSVINVNTPEAQQMETDTPYHLVSWNIGFGAYEADYDFFMDGGTQSWAWSKERLTENLNGISSFITAQNADLLLAQEVDIGGTRSYHVDERPFIQLGFSAGWDYACVFAQNYDSPFLFYPFTQPHGANQSGILSLSRFPISSAVRRELPIEESLMKLVDLDRCYSVSRIPTANGKELVLYNLHLSAYTSDGMVAVEQLELLLSDMNAEYKAGNYCIAGGDFNKDLPGNSGELFGVPVREGDTWAQPVPDGIVPDGLTLVVPLHADAPVASCRTAAEPYTPGSTFRVTVDGFVVSDNVTVSDSNVIETDYAYSDHNPVYLDFVLQ